MEYEYAVTATNDGNYSTTWSKRFDNALDAVNCFNSFVDHGFADEYRTVNLSEPNGKMHTKNFYRSGMVASR